jgi:large subunit ribosomal protein L22
MDVKSTTKNARISARKARDVAREIQGLPVSDALDILNFTPRKSAELFTKTMKTALADAENNFELPLEGLFVKSAVVGEGPTFKRFRARARGSASSIRKRTSHITVVLSDEVVDEKPEPKPKKKAAAKKEAPEEAKKEAPAKKKAKKESKASAKETASPEGGRVDEALGVVYDSAPSEVDDLKEIGGVGPKLEDKLNSIGVYRFDQIANWTKENIAEFDDLLSFKGRIERDEWVAKANELHDEKYGK